MRTIKTDFRGKAARWRPSLFIAAAALVQACSNPLVAPPRPIHADWTGKQIAFTGYTRFVELPNGEHLKAYEMVDGGDAYEVHCGRLPRYRLGLNALQWESQMRSEEVAVRSQQNDLFRKCDNEARRVCRIETFDGRSTFAVVRRVEWIGLKPEGDGMVMYVRCLTPDAFKQYLLTLKRSAIADDAYEQVMNLLLEDALAQ